MLAYQTAYLKAHYPVELLAASMTLDLGNTDKLQGFRREAQRMSVDIVPPELGGEIRVDPRKVTVGMKLIQRSAQLDVQELPVRALFRTGVSPQISFDPGVVDVILSGQPEVLNKVQKQSILAYVDCSSIGVAGEYELPVRIDVPPRVSVSEVKPAVIKVRVENL